LEEPNLQIANLLGYQHLILQAHLEYSGEGWAVYDHRFCQIAATQPTIPWHRGMETCGTQFMVTLNMHPTVNTALDLPTTQSSVVEPPRLPQSGKQDAHQSLENQKFVMSGTTHNAPFQAANTSMLVEIAMATPIRTAATILFTAQKP